MKPQPRDQSQIDIWNAHGKNFKSAGAVIGIAGSTLRWRLISWGEFTPRTTATCRDCGKNFLRKKNHARCYRCQQKETSRKKAAMRTPDLGMDSSRAMPPRRYDCRFYERCLDRAAKRNGRLACGGCKKYTAISIKEQAARHPSCAAKRIAEFTPLEMF